MQIKLEAVIQDRMKIDYMAGSPEQAALFLNWLGNMNFPGEAPAVEVVPQPTGAPEKEITLEMCSQLAVAIVNSKGRDAFNDVMSKFGVARLGELKREQFADVYNALEAAQNG